jgi:hypothetical protein
MTEEMVSWSHEQRCRKEVAALAGNGFDAVYCATPGEAADAIVIAAAGAMNIGFGGSMSVAGLGVESVLREMGKEILNHSNPALSREDRIEVMRRGLTCDLYLTGTNAVTFSGEMVNIDATGNRVASMIFGPRKVIVVAGRNKLVDGSPRDAIARVKALATPPNSRRLKFKTPCASSGFCSDCNSPDRLCRVTTVLDRRPRMTAMTVLVVNADLGF